MPVVPTPQVGLAPLPGVRVNPDVPAAAIPGAVNARPDLGGVAQVANQMYRDEVEKQTHIRVLDAAAQAGQLKNSLISQLLQTKGKDAFGAQDQIQQAWQKGVSDIGAGLSPVAQEMFAQHATSEGLDLGTTVQRHIASEQQRVADDTFNALSEQYHQDAIRHASSGDQAAVSQDIAKRTTAISDYAKLIGMPTEARDQEIAKATSQTQVAILGNILDSGDDLKASAYYQKVKDQILPSDQGRIEKALEASSTLGEAQRQSDAIIASNVSPTDALAKVESIADPKVRQTATQLVMQHFNNVDNLQRKEREDALARVITDMEQNGGRLNTGSLDYQTIRGHEEESHALTRQNEILHPRDPGDPDKFNTYLALSATSPATRQALATTSVQDILDDKTMSRGQKSAVINMIKGAANEQRASQLADLRGQQTENERAIKALQRTLKTKVDEEGNALDTDAKIQATQADLDEATGRAAVLRAQITNARRGDAPIVGSHSTSDTATADAPANPSGNRFGLSAPKPITADMETDLMKYGQGYADYLKSMGYAVPKVLPKPQEPKK